MAQGTKLNTSLKDFIKAQQMFFVATAAPDGRVNVSPKGMDSLRIINDQKIIWLNGTGSGNETAAHLLESPRMTLMFCAFEGDARIVRVYGNAKTTQPDDSRWEELVSRFPEMAGSRQIFALDIDLVQISCGTGVPLMRFESQRGLTELVPYFKDLGPDGVDEFWQRRNAISIDGKPTGIVRQS